MQGLPFTAIGNLRTTTRRSRTLVVASDGPIKTPEDTGAMARRHKARGVDVIDCSSGGPAPTASRKFDARVSTGSLFQLPSRKRTQSTLEGRPRRSSLCALSATRSLGVTGVTWRMEHKSLILGMGVNGKSITCAPPTPPGARVHCIGIDVNGIGQRIREARSHRGWSQNELASRAGVKQPTLQRIEAGLRQDPSIRTIAALAGALGVTIDALVDQAAPLPTPQSDASQLAFDAIEELTRHVAEVEARLENRIHALENSYCDKSLRTAT